MSRSRRGQKVSATVRITIAILSVSLLITAARTSADAEIGSAAPVVATRAGRVRGKLKDGVIQFLGIPYAAPPVGDLRWRPPIPHASWEGELDATRKRSWCAQLSSPDSPKIYGSEDCLYLNIYAPALAATRLPVMVWIHGGTFLVGSGAQVDGSDLARQGKIIVVTINYRLGALGYLASQSLDANDPRHTSGNYGLLDQQAAIRWVVDNIAAFGGDPRNVTIAGQSAGAISAGLMLVSPGASGLFQHAILESGPFLHMQTIAEAEHRGDEFAKKLGCASDTDPARCMRAKTTQQVVSAILADPLGRNTTLIWSPIVDGLVLPTQPAAAIAAGRVSNVPVIVGSTRDEGTLMIANGKPVSADRYEHQVRAQLGDRAATVLAAYPAAKYPSAARAAAAAFGDAFLSCLIDAGGELLSAGVPVYQYEFNDPDAPLTFFRNPPFALGSFHSAEIQYVFGDIANSAAASQAQRDLSTAMMDYWIRFITSGDPGGSARWSRYRRADPKILVLAPGAIKLESDFVTIHHCDMWRSILR